MKNLVFLFIGVLLYSCALPQSEISPTAHLISNVNVIDVRSGIVEEGLFVVIDSGEIKRVTKQISNQGGYSHQIDGSRQYLLPGLAEMHAHIPSPPTSQQRIEETLFLYLSNGITTIRGMLGHPYHLELREKVSNGDLLSPRILTSSPSLNGNTVQTAEEAQTKVRAYAEAGYDFLKIHPGIKLEVFETLLATANAEGIPLAGHVPVDVGIVRALKSKYATIDHIDGFLEGMVSPEDIEDPNSNGFFGYNFTLMAKREKIPELVALSKTNEVWIVPTQSLFERWFAPTTADEMLSQPEMKYMPEATLNNWRERKIQATGTDSGFDAEIWNDFIEIRRELMKAIQEDGHGLLLGSDAPQIFNVPGFSIHHEMEYMLKAGLSPLEIIQSGTINVAEYLGMAESVGEIKEGMIADAILVKANPLEDLSALKELSGVFTQGQWVSRAAIDEKLKEIAANAN